VREKEKEKKMASELTYRGGGGATLAGEAEAAVAAGGYSPKPSKPLAWLPRAARYAAGEHRPLFALAGMLVAAAIFSLATPYSSSTPAAAAAGSTAANPLARFSVEPAVSRRQQQLPARQFVGGKVPLGLKRKGLRVLVTGGAGFVGSHLVDRLVERGDSVIVVDNLFTGRKENVVHHFGNPNFEMIRHDVVEPILLEVDQIYHLACPASPVHYKYNPVKTIISFFLLRSYASLNLFRAWILIFLGARFYFFFSCVLFCFFWGWEMICVRIGFDLLFCACSSWLCQISCIWVKTLNLSPPDSGFVRGLGIWGRGRGIWMHGARDLRHVAP
jgi:hypothetical protein